MKNAVKKQIIQMKNQVKNNKIMVDNIDIIRPLLKFDSDDDFYYLQILQRKKENKQLGSNSKVIKNYYIKSINNLDKIYDEVKQLCDIFNARAMFRLNKRSFYNVSFKSMINVANCMSNKDYINIKSQYDRACGQCHHDKNKTWILDIDEVGRNTNNMILFIDNECQPDGNKFVSIIPSKNGLHLITKPFNIIEFKKLYLDIDIHKDNPTNLYIP